MNNRVISILLLALFSVVITFPGYGNSRQSLRKRACMVSSEQRTAKQVLLSCLATGINMIEEERTSEESQEDAPCEGVSFLLNGNTINGQPASEIWMTMEALLPDILHVMAIPCPPPDFVTA